MKGGKRQGSGRPQSKSRRVQMTVTVSRVTAQLLRQFQEEGTPPGRFLDELLRERGI